MGTDPLPRFLRIKNKSLFLVVMVLVGLVGPVGAAGPTREEVSPALAGFPADNPSGLSEQEWSSIRRQIQAIDPQAALDWSAAAKVTAPDGLAGDSFGVAVALDQGVLVVGAHSYGIGLQDNQGAAYVFYRHQGAPDGWGLVQKLTANDAAASDYFGSAVAVSGDTIVVGAPLADILGQQNMGAAYVFQRNSNGMGGVAADGWGQVAKLIDLLSGAAYDQFGSAVAISGGTVIVGAPRASPGGQASRGAAYIFARNQGGADNWGQVKPLSADGLGAYNYFGASVAIRNDTAVVGAYGADVGSTLGAGAAFVFRRNSDGAGGTAPDGWGQVHKLSASDGAASERFGWSVAVNERADYIAVGAPEASVGGNAGQGAAYVFFRNQGGVADSWDQVYKLTATDGAAADQFGYAVAISGATVLVGAPEAGVGGNAKQGAAYLFDRNPGGEPAWGQVGRLVASDGGTNQFFASAVAIDGDALAAGAWGTLVDGKDDQGATYLFHKRTDSWAAGAKITAEDGASNDHFGQALAIDGDTLVVGAPEANEGRAYVFARHWGGVDQWGLVRKLVAADAQAGDFFGRSVAIQGDTIVVGAPVETGGPGDPLPSAGAAYVFQRNNDGKGGTAADGWGQVRKLVAADAGSLDFFGISVSIHGDTLVVGATDEGAAGAAYLFQRNQGGADQWGQVSKLMADDAQANDYFGISVTIHGDTLVVGAPGEDGGEGDPLPFAGAAYLFQRNQGGADNWGQVIKLVAADAQASDYFGHSVAINGYTLVVGAYGKGGGASAADPLPGTGAAYVFQRNQGGADGWGQVKKLVAADAQVGDGFGGSVTLHGDTLVVGAYGEDGGPGDPLPFAGAAYLYQRNQGGTGQWGQVRVLVASDAQASDAFGFSVSNHGDTLVVGASGASGGAGDPPDTGAVYQFSALLKSNTTTTISAHNPSPSQIDQAVAVAFTVSVAQGATEIPTGSVTVSDGTLSCSGILVNGSGSCVITFTTPGVHNLVASYAGDERFNPSVSPTVAHQVNDPAKADTTTTITSHTPHPSQIGGSVTVAFTVSGVQGATSIPTGDVTVSDGTLNCTGTLANGSGSCAITFTTPGAHTLTAAYAGDDQFNASISAAVTHTVTSGHANYLPLIMR